MTTERSAGHIEIAPLAEGLRVARGDRLVQVIRIWGYRTRVEQDTGFVLSYLENVLPELLRILEHPGTDVGLRGAVAETLADFGVVLGAQILRLRSTEDSRLEKALELRSGLLQAYHLCFDHLTSVAGLAALAAALGHFETTPGLLALAKKVHDYPSVNVQRSFPDGLRLALREMEAAGQ